MLLYPLVRIITFLVYKNYQGFKFIVERLL